MKEVIDDSGREAMRRLVGQVPEDEVVPKKKRRFF
jgi:Ras family protein A